MTVKDGETQDSSTDTENDNENTEKLYTQAEVDEEVKGLKKNNEALLAEKKASEAKTREATLETRKANEENARKKGDMQTLETTLNEKWQDKVDGLEATIHRQNGVILGGKKEAVLATLEGQFTNDSAGVGRIALANMITVDYDESGNVVTSYNDQNGVLITTDQEQFKEYLKTNSVFKPLLKAVDSAGGGADGNSTNARGGGAKDGNSDSEKLSRAIPEFGDLPAR